MKGVYVWDGILEIYKSYKSIKIVKSSELLFCSGDSFLEWSIGVFYNKVVI